MNIIYFGSAGPLSAIPLKGLLDKGRAPSAVAFDARDQGFHQHPVFPVITEDQGSIESLARLKGIPVIELPPTLSRSASQIKSFSPDLIVVSCFARKLPDSILSIPTIGCVNLHPSLLPAYRGPVPVFWQFRDGVDSFGMTLHRMSAHLDAGHIIAQTVVEMPDGVSWRQANVLLGRSGSTLLEHALRLIEQHKCTEHAQDERHASYRGFPSGSDYVVSASWSAKRLYNFLCAVRDTGIACPCSVDGRVLRLSGAESYRETDDSPAITKKDTLVIPCSRGSVVARLVTG